MKTISKLCLGAALLLAVGIAPIMGADAPSPSPAASAAVPETADQKSARHEREVQVAQARIAVIAGEFPLLAAPGWQGQHAKFQAALSQLEQSPRPQRTPPAPVAVKGGKLVLPQSVPPPSPRVADLARMRQQADQVVAAHPELRDYVEQQFQWHQRMFELRDQFPDNPKVKGLVLQHLAKANSAEPPAPEAK